jgi:Caspase domain
MKTLQKCVSAATILLMLALSAKAQSSDNIFDPKLPMTWLGLDFSKAKFIGPTRDFGPSEKHKELMASWNGLLDKEQDKFNVKRFFKKQNVTLDFSLTNKNNGPLDIASMIIEKSEGEKQLLEEKNIREIVSNYDFSGLRGLGLMFVVESFDKTKGKSNVWITFINLNTQEVILTERKFGSPMGASLRSFWVNSILNMMERISRKDWDTWNKGNYKLVDGPVVAKKTQSTNPVKEPPIPKTAEVVRSIPEAKVSTTMAASPVVKLGGKYFALLIGVSSYIDDRLNLDNPVKDARRIKQVLTDEYNFAPENTIVLENPTRGDIFSALYKLRSQITASDNLLIFYAGHGYWDEKIRQGYWWPRDANASDPSNWLSNSDLREQLRGISSAHTLLVSDACFSGGLFRTRDPSLKVATMDYQMLYKMPSRRAITSGTLTTVPDNSVFVEYFLKRLSQNEDQFLPAQQLFNNIRLAIINNSATVPQEGVIAETGDEGGDFIFLKKQN